MTRVPRLATDDDGSGPARRGPLLQAWTRPSLGCLLPVPLSAGPASLSCVNVGECALHRPPREINKANVCGLALLLPLLAPHAPPLALQGRRLARQAAAPHAAPDVVCGAPKPWERTFRAGRLDVILLQVLGQSAAFAAHCPRLAAGSSAICPGGSDQGPRRLDLALIRQCPMIQLIQFQTHKPITSLCQRWDE